MSLVDLATPRSPRHRREAYRMVESLVSLTASEAIEWHQNGNEFTADMNGQIVRVKNGQITITDNANRSIMRAYPLAKTASGRLLHILLTISGAIAADKVSLDCLRDWNMP